jgi:hypothetical protein
MKMFNRGLKDKITALEKENELLYKKQFRVGDKVYTRGGVFRVDTPMYLRKSYNGGDCYYVSYGMDEIVRENTEYGVHVLNMSHNKPQSCECCGRAINPD